MEERVIMRNAYSDFIEAEWAVIIDLYGEVGEMIGEDEGPCKPRSFHRGKDLIFSLCNKLYHFREAVSKDEKTPEDIGKDMPQFEARKDAKIEHQICRDVSNIGKHRKFSTSGRNPPNDPEGHFEDGGSTFEVSVDDVSEAFGKSKVLHIKDKNATYLGDYIYIFHDKKHNLRDVLLVVVNDWESFLNINDLILPDAS